MKPIITIKFTAMAFAFANVHLAAAKTCKLTNKFAFMNCSI